MTDGFFNIDFRTSDCGTTELGMGNLGELFAITDTERGVGLALSVKDELNRYGSFSDDLLCVSDVAG